MNELAQKSPLITKGYAVVQRFASRDAVSEAFSEIFNLADEGESQTQQAHEFKEPIVTIFVAGFQNEQIIRPLSQMPCIKVLLDLAAKDVLERFDPACLFAYEITVFKKKQGSPPLQLHQDSWYHPFELTKNKFEYFSYYVPLTPFDENSSLLGLVDWSSLKLDTKYNERHIIEGQALNKTSDRPDMPSNIEEADYPPMDIGDCCIFEIRTPHCSREHGDSPDRYALSIRFGSTMPKLSVTENSRANFVRQLKKYGLDSFYWVRRPVDNSE